MKNKTDVDKVIDMYISELRESFSTLEFAYLNCGNAAAGDLTSLIGCVSRDGSNTLLKLEDLLLRIQVQK